MACVFCDLMASGDARWVAREPAVVAFLPPPDAELAPGHTLVVPRRHVTSLLDAGEGDVAQAAGLVRRVSQAMIPALGATGVVVMNASGPGSGQSVPHLHFHVVPRWDQDEDTLPWLRQRATRRLAAPAERLLAGALAALGPHAAKRSGQPGEGGRNHGLGAGVESRLENRGEGRGVVDGDVLGNPAGVSRTAIRVGVDSPDAPVRVRHG